MSRDTFLPIFPIPAGYFHEEERPCYHVPPLRPSWLRRLWQSLGMHAPQAARPVSAPQERSRPRARYPCDIYG
jgi:hypothetical protein